MYKLNYDLNSGKLNIFYGIFRTNAAESIFVAYINNIFIFIKK